MSFHPSYTFADADLVLASKGGTKFQVHSVFLKRASGFFRSMLEIQRDISEGPEDPIQMDESQGIVKTLLDVCYPDRSILASDITSFDFLRDLAFIFTEKYSVPAGVVAIRNFFFDSRVLSKVSSILLYGLAKNLSWKEEAAIAAIATLDIDFGGPESSKYLRLLNGKEVMDLFELRRMRRQCVLDGLKITNTKYISNRYSNSSWHDRCLSSCKSDGSRFQNDASWVAFLSLVSQELETRASGSGLEGRDFWAQPLAKKLSENTKCSDCGGVIVRDSQVLEVIRKSLKACPKEV